MGCDETSGKAGAFVDNLVCSGLAAVGFSTEAIGAFDDEVEGDFVDGG